MYPTTNSNAMRKSTVYTPIAAVLRRHPPSEPRWQPSDRILEIFKALLYARANIQSLFLRLNIQNTNISAATAPSHRVLAATMLPPLLTGLPHCSGELTHRKNKLTLNSPSHVTLVEPNNFNIRGKYVLDQIFRPEATHTKSSPQVMDGRRTVSSISECICALQFSALLSAHYTPLLRGRFGENSDFETVPFRRVSLSQ